MEHSPSEEATCFPPGILPSLIADFARRYPLIQISLVEETTANLARMLRHGQLDLMLDSSVLDATIYGYRKFQEEHLILAVPGAFPINNTLRSYQLPVEDILSKKFSGRILSSRSSDTL